MTEPNMVFVYSTFPDPASAERVARKMVERKLAACVNIFSGVRAIYSWQGEIQSDGETSVLFKTLASRSDELSRRLSQDHPSETPAIIRMEATCMEESYLAWMHEQVGP